MSQPIDQPLNFDFDPNSKDISRPVFVAGPYPMRITSVERLANKAGTGENLRVDFESLQETKTEKGESLPAGFFKLSRYYPLQASPDAKDATAWWRNLFELQDAALGTSQGNRPPLVPMTLIERTVVARVLVREAEGAFPRGNEIGGVSALRQ